MVAGMSVQVASLLLFMFMCVEFGWRAHKHSEQLNPKHAALYTSPRFKLFLCCKSSQISAFSPQFANESSIGARNNNNLHAFRLPSSRAVRRLRWPLG